MLTALAVTLPLATLTLAVQAQGKLPFSLDDIAQIARIGAPVLSPDGAWVAYTVTRTDLSKDQNISSVKITRTDGSASVQMSQRPQNARDPAWSPDGRYISFLASGADSPGSQVWLLDRRGGDARQLTHVHQPIEAYSWSPGSSTLLLTLNDGAPKTGASDHPLPIVLTRYAFLAPGHGFLTTERDHLYLYDIKDAKLTRLFNEPEADEEQDAAWSPDGRRIAFISQRDQPDPERTANADLYVTAATPGSMPLRLTRFAGVNAGPVAWSPNSRQIAYRQARFPGYSSYTQLLLAVASASGGPVRTLAASLDREVSPPVFTSDGNALLTTVVDDRSQYVAAVPLDSGAVHRLTHGEGVASSVATAPGITVVSWSSDNKFPELYALQPGGQLRPLSHANDALLAQVRLLPAVNLSAHSTDDVTVHGLLTFPENAAPGTKLPMLLYIHGGPVEQDAHDFTLTRQVFAGHGYAVLNVNYRGSNGRGYAYSRAIRADWGHKEVADLLAMVNAAIATGRIDPARIGVGGWSYGGILTDDLIATTNRFKAASAGASRANLLGVYGTNAWTLQYEDELGKPWRDTALYLRLSYPFLHADRIHTPTLFMGGDRDVNVPIAGSEQMYEAVRSVGTPAELVVYPGQFHIFTRPSFIRDRYQRWLDWYDHYLGPPASSGDTGRSSDAK